MVLQQTTQQSIRETDTCNMRCTADSRSGRWVQGYASHVALRSGRRGRAGLSGDSSLFVTKKGPTVRRQEISIYYGRWNAARDRIDTCGDDMDDESHNGSRGKLVVGCALHTVDANFGSFWAGRFFCGGLGGLLSVRVLSLVNWSFWR